MTINHLLTDTWICHISKLEEFNYFHVLQTNINIEKAFLELAEAILDKSNVQETKPVSVPLNQPAQRGGCPGCSQ